MAFKRKKTLKKALKGYAKYQGFKSFGKAAAVLAAGAAAARFIQSRRQGQPEASNIIQP